VETSPDVLYASFNQYDPKTYTIMYLQFDMQKGAGTLTPLKSTPAEPFDVHANITEKNIVHKTITKGVKKAQTPPPPAPEQTKEPAMIQPPALPAATAPAPVTTKPTPPIKAQPEKTPKEGKGAPSIKTAPEAPEKKPHKSDKQK
jgi:hypothetical protein